MSTIVKGGCLKIWMATGMVKPVLNSQSEVNAASFLGVSSEENRKSDSTSHQRISRYGKCLAWMQRTLGRVKEKNDTLREIEIPVALESARMRLGMRQKLLFAKFCTVKFVLTDTSIIWTPLC